MNDNSSTKIILDEVSSDAEKEIESILKTGLDEAYKIIEDFELKSKNEQLVIDSQQEKEFDIKSRQIIGAAEMQSRNSNLKLLEKNINKVFDTALQQFNKQKGKNYDKALELFINEGINSIDDDEILIFCNKTDIRIVQNLINKISSKSKKNLQLSDDSLKTLGGVIVTNFDGTVSVNNTIEERLYRMRAELRTDIVKKFN